MKIYLPHARIPCDSVSSRAKCKFFDMFDEIAAIITQAAKKFHEMVTVLRQARNPQS